MEGTTDEGHFTAAEAPVSAKLILQAEAVDADGRPAVAQQAVSVAGGDQ